VGNVGGSARGDADAPMLDRVPHRRLAEPPVTNAAVPLECQIECGTFSAATSQVFTGFAMLARAGSVSVRVKRTKASWRELATVLAVVLGDGTRLFYDLRDAARIHPDALDWTDHYFKRSYSPALAPEAAATKVAPLGFNYPVYSGGDWGSRRMLWNAVGVVPRGVPNTLRALCDMSELLSNLTHRSAGRSACPVEAFEVPPSGNDQPRVLLLTRTWDPATVQNDPALAETWAELNNMRAACIRGLRREFGSSVVSGFAPTSDARRDYPDCVVEDPRISRKPFYLEVMRHSDVCIATTGLAGSNGWRLGEYIASSRAIVSERLLSQVPGEFSRGTNYAEFVDPEGCIEQTVALVENRERRLLMMEKNQRYYEESLRPDRLVLNTLLAAQAQ
jgi:hypothetical protein